MNVESSNKKKRKLISSAEKRRPPKTHRVDEKLRESEGDRSLGEEPKLEPEGKRPWKNLQLILSLQNKEFDTQKKLELAFCYVKEKQGEGKNGAEEEHETVNTSRLIVFLCDWVQSLLISTENKVKNDVERSQSTVLDACLDFRCWDIFKFCLEESSKLHVSLTLSRNLLRSISYIARNVSAVLENRPLSTEGSFFIGEEFKVYSLVLDCVSMLFSSQGGFSNENLDMWISTTVAMLELVQKIYAENLEGSDAGAFVLKFSCLVIESFAKFLKAHPTRKYGFRDFVDKLLEPLLNLFGIMDLEIDESTNDLARNFLKLVEEVLSHGLFQPAHIDGFLGLRSTEKYVASQDAKSKDMKTVLKSYHRHLFDKLENIIAAKNVSILTGIGVLFHLLVDRVSNKKRASVVFEGGKVMAKAGGSKHMDDDLPSQISGKSSEGKSTIPGKGYIPGNLNAETRRSLFDFFVQTLEPFLLEMNGYAQAKLELGPLLSNIHCTLRSTTSLLSCLKQEKVYLKTEDISEGGCLNFLKKVYGTILSVASCLLSVKCQIDDEVRQMFNLSAKEVFLAIGYLLDIEYEVAGSDLVSLWLMILSYLAIGCSSADELDQSMLPAHIIGTGCQLISLYSELRQVNNTIFALCKAVRLVASHNDDGEVKYTIFLSQKTSLTCEQIARPLGILLSSWEFKQSIHNAIKSIPEGQASGCIHHVTRDILESIEWMKVFCSVTDGEELDSGMLRFELQAELLGRGLSEIYVLVLDSLSATTGNSNLLGLAVNDLTNVVRPFMNILVGLQPDCVNEFLFAVMGRNIHKEMAENKRQKYIVSTSWAVVFFFRLHMSCRSLYRQIISLKPLGTLKKISAMMGDSFLACSGKDWMEKTDWTDEGYFSSIVQPSASLLDIIKCMPDIYFKNDSANCCPLIYVLHTMALQRLVDLNRHINSFEYLLQNNDNLLQIKALNDDRLSVSKKRSRNLKRRILALKREAEDLTNFMMGYLPFVVDDQLISTNFQSTTQQLNHIRWDFNVSGINKKSLPIALWWVICQNIDVWCCHANNKKLKKFLSLLVHTSIPCTSGSFNLVGACNIDKADRIKKVTVHQISSELLSDSILYEHKFIRRNLASRFCHILEKSVLLSFKDLPKSEIDFNSSPNWPEVLSTLDKLSVVVSGKKHTAYDSGELSNCDSSNKMTSEICKEDDALQLASVNFNACQHLLNLLCWMPKGFFKSKSFELFGTYILNLERLVISCLLQSRGALSSHDQYELFRLFVSSRRTLKCIIMASCEENLEHTTTSFIPTIFDGPFLVLWLLKSLYMLVDLQGALFGDRTIQATHMIFSLMDHTSYIFLTLSKYGLQNALHFFPATEKPCKKQLAAHECILNEPDLSSEIYKVSENSKSVFLVSEALKEQAESLLISLKNALCNENVGVGINVVNWNRLSSILSCIGGFLCGLASAVNETIEKSNVQKAKLKRKHESMNSFNHCVEVFSDFITAFLELFVDDDGQPQILSDGLNFEKLKSGIDSYGAPHQKFGSEITFSASFDLDCNSKSSSNQRNRLELEATHSPPVSGMSEIDLLEAQSLKKHFLLGLLKGDHPEAAFLLRQLLIASSAILRLNLHIDNTPFSSHSVPIFVGISRVLLSGLVDMVEISQPFSLAWLDGVVKYLEELGSHFPLTTPTTSRNAYCMLIELQLRTIGKCICLQGKGATLASHETESSTKMFHGGTELSESSLSHGPYCLDEFKVRLRMSFKAFIGKSSELHMFSAIQTIERALVGVQEGYVAVYGINTGNAGGGKVSSTVAGGVDCLDLILEYALGRKRLNVVKRHIQSLVAALFNIILHLQSPLIFFTKPVSNRDNNDPDPGSVVLMCVEVLTRVSGKHALFQLDSWHIAQSLHIPAALFQDLPRVQLSGASIGYETLLDRRFSMNLFAACCRLLHTVLKHHKSESEKCLAILEESVSVLLHSLEPVDNDYVIRKDYFFWKIQEGIKCACFLRRVYEELRQQKDIFGRHCFKFLSTYIGVYSGFGPLRRGIRREVDEALRPGVYALVDACSAEDLQYLHTVFGEGPCRNTLATLQHDYKLNFRYEGKV